MVKLESVHGGHNNVAVGVRKGSYKEEVLADALAKRVAELTGARYIKQDSGDVNQNLAYFVREMDKKRGANLSIHFNAFNNSANGTESYSYDGDDVGEKISINMSKKVSDMLGTFNRGNKNAPLYVIDRSIDVTTLLEVCFLDNDSDMKKFIAKREEVAHAIASCYENYKGNNTTEKPKEKSPVVNEPYKPRQEVRAFWFPKGHKKLADLKKYCNDNKIYFTESFIADQVRVNMKWFSQNSPSKMKLIEYLEKNNINYDMKLEFYENV